MTLEFEKLTPHLEQMARSAVERKREDDGLLETALEKLRRCAVSWERIERCLKRASAETNEKFFRAARPLSTHEPLDQGIPAPQCPPEALVIASDGSQIMPDRHGEFLYYLINVGLIIYEHGHGRPPQILTHPTLEFPRPEAPADPDLVDEDEFVANSGAISVRRDMAEIGLLADTAWEWRQGIRPALAVLDQRLLYWPIGSSSGSDSHEAIQAWLRAMKKAQDAGALLAGYIDRPGKSSVMTMLATLDIEEPDFDLAQLTQRLHWQRPNDTDLYERILRPGERSPVFVDISHHNRRFAEHDPALEVCFFYLNPGRGIARVDIPRWVADEATAVAAVHSLLYDQCQILGDYPYALTRADEIAVVGRREQEELEHRIALKMQDYGLTGSITGKQQAKNYARSDKTRYE
jgi:hypothetical protein